MDRRPTLFTTCPQIVEPAFPFHPQFQSGIKASFWHSSDNCHHSVEQTLLPCSASSRKFPRSWHHTAPYYHQTHNQSPSHLSQITLLMGNHWSPTYLPVPTVRDRGNPLDSTDFGKKVLKERGLQEDPKPEAESRTKFNPVNLFLFFQPVGHKTTKPQKARSETRAKQQKEAEKEAVYKEYKDKAKDISITYLLAYSFLGGRFRKRYDDKVKAANDRRRAAGKPTK